MSAKKYAKIHSELTEAKKENENKLRLALRKHIMRERDRKKQQELETAKEEQLRNEREARKKQDNIRTLGKTQEEIQQVEEQMIQLKNKKHQLFLQLKALITKEVEMEKIRKEADLSNVRNEVGMPYQPYNNDKGVKRPHSPMTQDYYKHGAGQPQRLYLSPKTDAPGRLWYNTAKYQSQPAPHQPWPGMGNVPNNRYTLQPSVPAPHSILIPHNDHQQPPPQLVKQHQSQAPPSSQQQQPKTNSISIEKISGPQQADFTIHRRLLPPTSQAPPGQMLFAPGSIVYPEYIAQNRDFQNK